MENFKLDDSIFLLESIQEKKNAFLLNSFRAPNEQVGITNFFKKKARKFEESGSCRTYVVKINDNDENNQHLILAFTIKLDPIPYISNEKRIEDNKIIPAFHIMYLSKNESISDRYKISSPVSIGTYIYSQIIEPFIYHIANLIGGIDLLYLYAINPTVSDIYKNWGFSVLDTDDDKKKIDNKIQSESEKGCIFMYKKLDTSRLNPKF